MMKRIDQTFNDSAITSRGAIRVVGDSGVVWINVAEIDLDEEGNEVSRKMLPTKRLVVHPGEVILGVPVEQISPEWLEEEKILLARGKIFEGDGEGTLPTVNAPLSLISALIFLDLVKSRREAKQKIAEGAVRIDGSIQETDVEIEEPCMVSMGKRKHGWVI